VRAVTAKPMVIPNKTETKWFVSFEALGEKRRRSIRETKIFSSEEEARLCAKEMVLAKRNNVLAGTFMSPQATRRIISGQELHSWIANA
jgi:hypothetical protein